VDMLVHIDVVRTDDDFGFEAFVRHTVDLRLGLPAGAAAQARTWDFELGFLY
jgi:hypothetical protein